MSAPPAPDAFGKFRLLSRIGEGGMGIVYRAELETPDGPRAVVLKRMRPEFTNDKTLLKMMAQEARLGALLRHPCLVPVLEAGEIDGELYMVLPYVDGHDLSQILERAIRVGKHVPIGVACWLAMEAAEALEYAHSLRDERGHSVVIAHRDISPSNVMVTRDGTVKLLDFGIAKASEHVAEERTRTGTMKGKFAYFSPEQANGLELDARSDLFSLGIVLMELLLQRRLFRGTGDFDTLRRVREAVVPKPSSVRPEIDADLDAVLLRVLKPHREERYASARDLVDALEPIVARLGGGAEATRAYFAALGPIEHRVISSDPGSAASPPEIEDETAQLRMMPTKPSPASAPPASKPRQRAGARRTSSPVSRVERSSPIARVRSLDVPRPAGVPRWKAYLGSLPAGASSFPQCTVKAAVVRNYTEHFGAIRLPPDMPNAVREMLDNPPLVSSYVPGVVARLYFLAIADVLDLDDDKFVERAYESNVHLLASPLYKMLFAVMSTDRLIKNAKSRWGAFHHGIDVSVIDHGHTHAHVVLRTPPGFEPVLVHRMHATGMRAALEAVGARSVRMEIDLVAPGEAHYLFSWGT